MDKQLDTYLYTSDDHEDTLDYENIDEDFDLDDN